MRHDGKHASVSSWQWASCTVQLSRVLLQPFALPGSILIQFLSQGIPRLPLGRISELSGRALFEVICTRLCVCVCECVSACFPGLRVSAILKGKYWRNNEMPVPFFAGAQVDTVSHMFFFCFFFWVYTFSRQNLIDVLRLKEIHSWPDAYNSALFLWAVNEWMLSCSELTDCPSPSELPLYNRSYFVPQPDSGGPTELQATLNLILFPSCSTTCRHSYTYDLLLLNAT